MNFKFFSGAMMAAIAASCVSATASEPNYNLTLKLTPDEDDIMVYMTNYDTGEKIDSAIVADGVAHFQGNIDAPVYVRMIGEGTRMGDFILEPAQITVDATARKVESTGEFKAKFDEILKKQSALVQEYNSLPNDSTSTARRKAIYDRYQEMADSALNVNGDNIVGYLLFINSMYELDAAGLNAALDKFPAFRNSKRVRGLQESLQRKAETSVGAQYKDFAITNDGKTQKLSDYVGNGHYTLVDFWASWCGPCIRETKVIKQLYEKYNGKGLEVLGVAVWDEPQNTLKAIEDHQLPWNQILNAQTIPTDLYGISGIPCIILIDPNGKIVSRDKQEEELIADVEAAMNAFQASQAAQQ